jgi:hypothetical protein
MTTTVNHSDNARLHADAMDDPVPPHPEVPERSPGRRAAQDAGLRPARCAGVQDGEWRYRPGRRRQAGGFASGGISVAFGDARIRVPVSMACVRDPSAVGSGPERLTRGVAVGSGSQDPAVDV